MVPWQEECGSTTGARAMSYNVYLAYMYHCKTHVNARVKNVPEEQSTRVSLSVVLTEIHLLLPIKPLQTKHV